MLLAMKGKLIPEELEHYPFETDKLKETVAMKYANLGIVPPP